LETFRRATVAGSFKKLLCHKFLAASKLTQSFDKCRCKYIILRKFEFDFLQQNQPAPQGLHHGFGARVDTEFAENRSDVKLDRVFRDI
jgi:hypothetical protein